MSVGDAAEPAATPGTEIGDYRVVGVIGRGGMGLVLEARHTRVGQRAALKVLTSGRRGVGDSAVRRFLAEIDVLTRLDHPGLVRVLDAGDSPAHGPWVAMEYVAGDVLRAHLTKADGASLPLAFALRIGRRVASAMAAIHRAGIVHRDLKPENIMVVPDDEVPGGQRVKLLDFGIAKLTSDDAGHTTEGTVLGTAGYMAPEQCTGLGDVDERADVYALGVILFEMLTGARPFAGASSEVMRQHLFVEPPVERLPAALPEPLRALVTAMLAKEPTRRPATVEVVARLRALEAEHAGVLEDEPALPHADTLPARVAPAETVAGHRLRVVQASQPSTASLAAVSRETPAASVAKRRWPWVAGAAAIAAGVVATAVLTMRPGARGSKPPLRALPGMVIVEGARFGMGSTPEEVAAACAELGGCDEAVKPQLARESPVRQVTVSTFQIDIHEVTNREFSAFLNANSSVIGLREDSDEHYPRFVVDEVTRQTLFDLYVDGGIERRADGTFAAKPGKDDLPVIQVTWDGASRYCRHVGKRLPTEAEWELAARGVSRRRFPWGDAAPRCDGVRFGRGKGGGCADPPATLAPVGTSPQDVTPSGIHDLGGNASEWVQDPFVSPTYTDCGSCRDPIAVATTADGDDMRLFRGGNFKTPTYVVRATTRSRWKRDAVGDGLGFRCVAR